MDKVKYKKMSQKLSSNTSDPWDNARIDTIDPEEEIKVAFTKMTDNQLQFHLSIPGKNHDYAKAILESRKKSGTVVDKKIDCGQ